jgi:hypothetical protein
LSFTARAISIVCGFTIGGNQMKRLVFTFLSAGAVCAFISATPTLAGGQGNGNDAIAQADQAQFHPMMVNQYPASVPQGEVYLSPEMHGRSFSYGAAGTATAQVH